MGVTPELPALIEIQKAQASELIQSAGKTDLPVVYAGDFNTVVGSPTYQILVGSDRVDAWQQKKEFHKALADFTEAVRLDLFDPIARRRRADVLEGSFTLANGSVTPARGFLRAIADMREQIHGDFTSGSMLERL